MAVLYNLGFRRDGFIIFFLPLPRPLAGGGGRYYALRGGTGHGLLITSTTTNTMARIGERKRKKKRKKKEKKKGGRGDEKRKENGPGDFYSLPTVYSHLQPHRKGVREMQSLVVYGGGGKPSK